MRFARAGTMERLFRFWFGFGSSRDWASDSMYSADRVRFATRGF
jgi:hypothetical protein